MPKAIKAEIKQKKPFPSSEAEVYVNLQRTADRLLEGFEKTLKSAKISQPQYNVLRILRGSAPNGLPCGEIAQRMITRDPDITRLLDRMEAQDLVTRSRDTSDRRVVKAKITGKGLRIVASLDAPVEKLHQRQLSHLSSKQLRQLNDLLDLARAKSV